MVSDPLLLILVKLRMQQGRDVDEQCLLARAAKMLGSLVVYGTDRVDPGSRYVQISDRLVCVSPAPRAVATLRSAHTSSDCSGACDALLRPLALPSISMFG